MNTIIKEAQEYISNDLTEKDTAKKLGISVKTLQLHFKKLKDIDPILNDLVLMKNKRNVQAGRIEGAKKGKATPTYTSEEANKKANGIISKSYTYEEAAAMYGIPKSTIYDMVHNGDFVSEETRMQLDLVAEHNNKNKNAKRITEKS